MKHLKMLLGVTVLTGSMILVGCGGSTESKKEEVASTQVAQETETVDTKEEETIEVLGLDGERAEMEGYSIGLLDGWYKMQDTAVAGYDGIKNDQYQSGITITKEQGPGYTDIERLKEEMESQLGYPTTIGKAACGDYIIIDVPATTITEEMLNEMIKTGQITQEMVDEKGGMEQVLAVLNEAVVPQKMIYIPVDNNSMISITASLYPGEETAIQEALDFTVGSMMIK